MVKQNTMAVGAPGGGGCSLLGGQEAEREERSQRQDTPTVPSPKDLLPPARSHLLKFPESSKIVPPLGDQAFST
jgi:hypothetical protein